MDLAFKNKNRILDLNFEKLIKKMMMIFDSQKCAKRGNCRHPILSGIFQIHFSQNQSHFWLKDFHSYEIPELNFKKIKVEYNFKKSQSRVKFEKLIFLYSVSLVESIMEIKIGYPKLDWCELSFKKKKKMEF